MFFVSVFWRKRESGVVIGFVFQWVLLFVGTHPFCFDAFEWFTAAASLSFFFLSFEKDKIGLFVFLIVVLTFGLSWLRVRCLVG